MATSIGMLRCTAAVAGASATAPRASGRVGTSFRASVAPTLVARSGAVVTRASIEQVISDLATGVGLPCTVRRDTEYPPSNQPPARIDNRNLPTLHDSLTNRSFPILPIRFKTAVT
jgi:hypothetical protein